MTYLNTPTWVQCDLLQVHLLSKCDSIKQTWVAGITMAFDLVTLSTLKTWRLKSPWSTNTSTPFFNGWPDLRSSSVRKSCCHMLLLSVKLKWECRIAHSEIIWWCKWTIQQWCGLTRWRGYNIQFSISVLIKTLMARLVNWMSINKHML